MKKSELTICDLFAGVGGIRLAFEKAGFKTIFANDIDPKVAITYNLNFSNPKMTIGDIWKLNIKNIPKFDILIAGFPCQPFSIAGEQKGFKDMKNGNLFYRIMDIIKIKKPQIVFLENVKNLKSHDNGRTFKIIIKLLEGEGYCLKYKILNALDFGLPQNRERIFIVGFKDKRKCELFEFPKTIQLLTTFKDYLDDKVDDKYYYNNKPLFKQLSKYDISSNFVYQWRRVYLRENKKGVVPTLTANMGTGGHNVPIIKDNKGIRKLTPRECFRLQGFPNTYKLPNLADSYLYHQAGNSVPINVVEAIAEEIKRTMDKKQEIK